MKLKTLSGFFMKSSTLNESVHLLQQDCVGVACKTPVGAQKFMTSHFSKQASPSSNKPEGQRKKSP